MQHDIDRILIDRNRIASRVQQLAEAITNDIAPDGTHQPIEITLVPILTGSIIFLADLIRHIPIFMQIRLVSVSSYRGPTTHSDIAHVRDDLTNLPQTLTGSHILVIDDILDSGQTLKLVTEMLRDKNPASLRTCVLLRKDRPDALDINVDYVAFDIPDEFVVGYGLDYNNYYRNLPDIVTLKSHILDHDTPQGDPNE